MNDYSGPLDERRRQLKRDIRRLNWIIALEVVLIVLNLVAFFCAVWSME